MRPLLIATLAAVLASGVAAQGKLYEVRLPDGRILFTDQPPAGAVILSERELPPPAPAPAPKAAEGRTLQERAAKLDGELRERAARRNEAYAAVLTAEREFEQARERLERGREPLEGELLGTAKGRVRLGPAYEERLAGLEKAVADAQQKLAKARAEFNALR